MASAVWPTNSTFQGTSLFAFNDASKFGTYLVQSGVSSKNSQQFQLPSCPFAAGEAVFRIALDPTPAKQYLLNPPGNLDFGE